MIMTKHAQTRSSQRTISSLELAVYSAIGIEVEQKGGASLVTIKKGEKQKWIVAIKEALNMLPKLKQLTRKECKRTRKVLNRILERLNAKHPPYLVVNPKGNKVITCGHLIDGRIKRNY